MRKSAKSKEGKGTADKRRKPYNPQTGSLVPVTFNIPKESADILAAISGQIRHFDGPSTCAMKMFAPSAIDAISRELTAKDAEMGTAIAALAKEHQILL